VEVVAKRDDTYGFCIPWLPCCAPKSTRGGEYRAIASIQRLQKIGAHPAPKDG